MAANRSQSESLRATEADTIEEQLRELRMCVALEERECAELEGKIKAEELPRQTRHRASEQMKIVVKGEVRPFQQVLTAAGAFEKEPYSFMALRSNHVYTPKQLQRITWPVLQQNSDTFLLAPEKAGKFMSLLPIIARHALRSRVIIASSRKRCVEYYTALVNIPLMSPFVLETTIGRRLEANIIACPFAALPKVALREKSFVCVLDGLDQLAEQGCTSRLRDILHVVATKSSRVIATARTLSDATLELTRKIGFRVVVSMQKKPDDTERNSAAETRIEMCDTSQRYGVLKRYLKEADGSANVVLVLVKNRRAANCLENELADDGIYAQSLHAEEDADRDLAGFSLRSKTPGVFIAVPSDFSWLQEIERVDLLVDLQNVRSPSAFSIRESRVKSSGTFVMFVEPSNVQTAAWLVPLFRQRNKPLCIGILRMHALHNALTRQLLEFRRNISESNSA